jgi:NAD(P)-dependent dehydrogenase (short-subunit alcohol dehydrogenase family)
MRWNGFGLVAAGAGALALAFVDRLARGRGRLRGKTAVVCGASRGLGLEVARELVRRGCRVAICARTPDDVDEACVELRQLAGRPGVVWGDSCDLRAIDDVELFLANAESRLGPIDVLVANAATLTVGPIERAIPRDFDEAMDSIFVTARNAALAVLPRMQARREGSIAFVTSIGGKLGVPHLTAYSAAKFAEIGFAEALRAEVAKDHVHVLTIVPGLMRTGSFRRAFFQGDADAELAWFGASANAPVLTIGAERAARRIVRAIERRDEELVYTLPARIAARTHDLVPWAFRRFLGAAGRLLPRAPSGWAPPVEGREILANR